MTTRQRVVVDFDELSAKALKRATEKGVRQAAEQLLADLRRSGDDRELSVRLVHRAGRVEALIVEGSYGSTDRMHGGGGVASPPPIPPLMRWARKKGLRPRGKPKARGEKALRSVAFALRKSIERNATIQRGAKRAVRKALEKKGAPIKGKKAWRAHRLLTRIMARQLAQAVR